MDEHSWKEWHVIDQPNIDPASLTVSFDYYNSSSEEHETIYYDQDLGDFELIQVAIEEFYPFNIDENHYIFELSTMMEQISRLPLEMKNVEF